MKFRCNQHDLSRALNIVSKAVTSRTTIPILKGILLEADEKGNLKMVASDLDITIEEVIKVEDVEKGSVVVQAKLFSDIIRKLPGKELEVEVAEGKVVIRCMNSEFSIVGMPADEFPEMKNEEEGSGCIEFDSELLKSMIRKTSFAASIDESKGVITGILTELKSDEISMVAIDGYRMAISREPMVNTDEKSIIICDISSDSIEKIKLLINNRKAVFVIENVKVALRLLDGEFIKYRDILPKEDKIQVRISRRDLLDSIERASLLSKEGKNNLIKLAISDNLITITSRSEEGNVREDVLAQKTGDDLEIGFNAKYVLDVLKVIDDDEIIMKFNTGITPCLVHPVEGNSYEYLILPVRITGN